ncbi:uncharacterized protein GGS22DRAFT_29592 [Annulohypoxylon maeteangense]|uniref:uncharacterized protein n=1 Tax=Annulohypoxylon maeteangense TaxID=1927788 RepID=UPI002008530D|nr:uncharacterized protein GGS22DRAFT_29592 [Annulohypoxylon maeteangense]KAI0883373.1 hypothetical protein GGS22DRAFT_29592 [Annulohypoxylon maeteangense]
MSSMLKKTGGLSFKPKVAPRRPAASSSQAPRSSASANTTQAPTAENSSQASTPASAAPSPAPSVEPSRKAAQPQEATKEITKEISQEGISRPHSQAQKAHIVQPESRPASTPAVSPTVVEKPSQAPPVPTPSPSESASQPTTAPVLNKPPQQQLPVSIPATQRTAQPTPAPETTHSDRSTPTPSSNTPVIATSRRAGALYTPTPEPTAPTQIRTAPPSPAPVSDTIAVSAPVDEPSTNAPKKRKVYRKRKSTEDGTGAESSAPKRRRARKNTTTEDNGTAPSEGGRGRSRQHERSSSPEEDPENQTVDHSSTKMGELTKDMGIGKRFKHADAIEERAREARERFRLKQQAKRARLLGLDLEDVTSRASTPAGDGEGGRESAAARARELGASIGANSQSVGYEVVDGQIVVNQQSLMVDRHAAHDMGTLETVEEDEFSRLTTSSSFRRESRRTGANHWTDEDTDKFYRLLGMFGTDFETISAMFPEKSRRAVKLKFNREERLRPRYINATVMVRGEKKVDIDLEEYKKHQHGWQESDKIMAEHNKLVREHNEDIRRLKEERRAAGLMDEDEEVEGGGEAGGAQEGEEQNGEQENAEDGEGEDEAHDDGNEDIDGESEPVEEMPAGVAVDV